MKVNPLLNEIYKGLWLLDHHSISSYGPIISKILAGDEVIFQNTNSALMQIKDRNGKRVQPEEDGGYDLPAQSVAHVYMNGPILKHGDFCTYGADEIVGALRFANEAKNIKGTVLHIDGPGGSVSAIGPFRAFAKERKKPIVGLIDSAYSAHYWAACAVCDVLLADNDISFGVGSVGVVLSFADTKPVLEAQGYVFHEIYPKESEHKNEAFTLALKGDYKMIREEHLAPLARKFQAAVRQSRPGLVEEVGVLTGKTFGYEKAMEYNMIDGLASVSEAIERIDILAEIKNFTNNNY